MPQKLSAENTSTGTIFAQISKLFRNEHTLLITSCCAIVSALASSIVYLFNELVLSAWKISPDMVGNISERRGFLHVIILSGIYYVITVFAQTYLQNKLVPIMSICFLRKQHAKTLNFIKEQHYLSKHNQQRLQSFAEQRERWYRKMYWLSMPSIIPPIFLVLVCSCMPWLIANRTGAPTLTITSINFAIMVSTPIVFAWFDLPAEVKAVRMQKHVINDTNSYAALSRISKLTINTLSKVYSPLQINPKDIVTPALYSFFAAIVVCFMAGPMSVRNQKTFWIAESNNSTYVIPYVTNGEAVAKLAVINEDGLISIYLNTQIRFNIDDKMLHSREFKAVHWVED